MTDKDNSSADRVPVWDLTTRLFHWGLVAYVTLLMLSGHGFALDMDAHMAFGKVALALILFRFLWGFIGSTSARFQSFVKGPGAIADYAKAARTETEDNYAGHNPAGGWMVMILLLSVGLQAALGLFSSEPDELIFGPLAAKVSSEMSHTLTELHEANSFFLLALIGLHVAAILFYAIAKRIDLVRPMVDGKKKLGSAGRAAAAALKFSSNWVALVLFALILTAVLMALRG